MLKVENVEVYGWEAAIRGARNPMNSWDRIDSGIRFVQISEEYIGTKYTLGPNDYKMLKGLCIAGTDHRKFMRMITVTMDITAPLYWWKEYDTYKVGTVANSCSTMHKIHAKEFTLDDFSHEHLINDKSAGVEGLEYLEFTIGALNKYRNRYLENKCKTDWWQMIQLLPSSYNQKRTVQLNYEVLNTMYKARNRHKLDEWITLCFEMGNLPYSEFITMKF